MYYIELKHEGLKKYRRIQGSDKEIVEAKAAMLAASWNELWEKRIATENRRKEKEDCLRMRNDKRQIAVDRTLEAQKAIDDVRNILNFTLKINDAIEWQELFPSSVYSIPQPKKPNPLKIPPEPKASDLKLYPEPAGIFPILSLFFNNDKVKELAFKYSQSYREEQKKAFESSYKQWEQKKDMIEQKSKELLNKYTEELENWNKNKLAYFEKVKLEIARILEKKKKYLAKDEGAIVDYCEMVLARSKYPETFPQQYELNYNPNNRLLLVDYFLPSPSDIPKLKEVKYNRSLDQFKEYFLSESAANDLYDKALYEITLRTIHELYEADVIDVISSIVFNGYVKSIDEGTGGEVTACILSVQANKEDFLKINLGNVEPKACFRALKGIGSSKLHGLAAVAPLIKMDKEDKRFVDSYTVVNNINDTTNIAAMDWQDFENLIRELFEKEFAPKGGEVKITRASRDEGVDAVIFDPDPLRGGKIVIQAKRYTNVVGVSAVRDLYGTVMNEGAMKGILVTTTDYGPDAYKFAQDKPLTLLNGGNLLHLLEKHGHKAKIDIREAKKILGEKIEN
jgi:restriction system protein